MQRFESRVDQHSEDFQTNRSKNLDLVHTLVKRQEEWSRQGPAHRVQKAKAAGKLLGRERLDLILDQDSPFLEIMPLRGWEDPEWEADSSSSSSDPQKPLHRRKKAKPLEGSPMVGGVGLISGVLCVVVAWIPTSNASIGPITGTKWQRCSEVSHANRLPFVQLLESGGADLDNAFDIFHSSPNAFKKMAERSAELVPTVTIVFGTSIAGGAYFGGMSDYIIMVKEAGQLALAGSKLTQTATGETSTDEELGGAELHSRTSGVSDYLAQSEEDAIVKARQLISSLPSPPGVQVQLTQEPFLEPFLDPEDILGVVSSDSKHAYDAKEVIARLVDDSRMHEFKPDYGSTIVCVWAKLCGHSVAIVGNNGVIFPAAAQKAAHFLNIANQRGTPVVFLHNVTGFMVGKQYEAQGMIKWGSLMVNAASNLTVPKFSVLVGGSFGAANFAMAGRGYDPDFIFSWPQAKCAVMGPDQLAGVMQLLAEERVRRRGLDPSQVPGLQQQLDRVLDRYRTRITREMSAYYYSAQGVDDGIIDPRDTRTVLGLCLSATAHKPIRRGFMKGVNRL